MTEFLEIDGSILEGGGQILRISVSLSAILGLPVRVTNIRAGRAKPGLAAQHLKGIHLVGQMCQAKVKGAELGSTEIEFNPGRLKGGHYVADTQTAGSISLLLQVALPCALYADGPVTLELKGGTNADMAPQIDFMTDVFRHSLKRFGADFSLKIHRRGYYPKGGGHVIVEVNPVRQLHSVNITDPGTVCSVHGKSFVAGVLPIKMAYQMAEGAKRELNLECDRIKIDCYKENREMAPNNCSGIILSCETTTGCVLGADGLGKRGVDAASVGAKAGSELREALQTGACVDPHVQDQIVIYMALAKGKSVVRTSEVTLHTKTAIYIAEEITKVTFRCQTEAQPILIECNGLSFVNNNSPL